MIADVEGLTLQIPNDMMYVDIVTDAAEAFAAKVGFNRVDAAKIRLVVEEGVCNIIAHAFEPEEKALFTVSLIPIGFGLRIMLHDNGLPYTPPEVEPGKTVDDIEKSIGTRLMRGLMDKFSYVNLGPGGKKLVMEKYFGERNVSEAISASELKSYQAEVPQPESAERIPRTIRLFQPDNQADAVEIAQCAYKTYGYGYFYADIYYPEKLTQMIRDGTMVSCVAKSDLTGDMMGHCAIKLRAKGDKVAENAVAFVKPRYRGQSVLGDLSAFRIRQARAMGLKALYTNAVMTHPASQKNSIKSGFIESGIVLSALSPVDWKGLSPEGKNQRVSALHAILYLEEFPEATLFLPSNHAEMLKEIYAWHNRKTVFAKAPRAGQPEEERSIVETGGLTASRYACINFVSIGKDSANVLRGQLRRLARTGIAHMTLQIPLQSPFAPMLSAEAEKLDFYFSGATIDHEGRDMLMLQHNNCEVAYESISTPTEFGRRLLEYIRRNDPAEHMGSI